MNSDRTRTEPFRQFLQQAREICGFWARFTGGSILFMAVVGIFVPLATAVFLFTLGLPILLLFLWGCSLDQELQWTDLDEGPW
ncbi:MAG: hypothetical protein AAF409_01045 [Pseudomonadota bacterium]